jgi:hypothetical protein
LIPQDFIFSSSRGSTWPHVTSDGTAFINVTGAVITLEFDVRVNSKGAFEFFLLHNQVTFCYKAPVPHLKVCGHQVNLGQLGLKLVSGYGSTASWFFGIFVAVMRTNVQVSSPIFVFARNLFQELLFTRLSHVCAENS